MTAVTTGALGYLGAAEDDQRRWLEGFRLLLDGLDRPVQLVMRLSPGSGDEGRAALSSDPRTHDLQFAEWLRDQPSAQCRNVTVVTALPAAGPATAALTRGGIPLLESHLPSPVAPGTEWMDCYEDASGFHHTWAVDRLPGLELEPGWLLRLAPPELAIVISCHIVPLPASWAMHILHRQLVQLRAEKMAEGLSGMADPRLAALLPDTETLQRQLAASREKAFHLSLYVTLSVPDRAALKSGTHAVEAAGRAALCQLRPCYFRMQDGHVSTLPLGVDRLGNRRIVNTSTLLTLYPWLDADIQHPGGLVLGSSRATGSPVVLDPFDERLYANANIGVFGHSGAGKTHLLSSLLMSSLAAGTQVFVIDPEHEYAGLARALGGVAINLQLGSGQALNVMELRPNAGEGPPPETWLGPAVADAVDLIAIVCGGMDEPERALAEAAVRRAYEERPQPILRDVAERLPQDSRTGRVLTRWITGSLGAIFSAPTNIDLDAELVVFGMRELREELVGPVHFLLAEALWSRIKTRSRRRLLIVDELGLLFEDATIRRFVVSLARRIRKYNGSLVFATQNPGDLLASEAGAVVATNPACHFFGAQRPGEAAKLQRVFQLSDAQRAALESARRGEFLLAAGSERLPLTVRMSPRQTALLEAGRSHGPP